MIRTIASRPRSPGWLTPLLLSMLVACSSSRTLGGEAGDACPEEHLCGGACVDVEADPHNCGGCGLACPGGEACRSGACCTPFNDDVDLLLMVDNSNTMAEQQALLVEQLPRLVGALASGDVDDDGTRDFPPVRSLHVGVVSSDMGTGGFTVPTCFEPSFGDDGVLRTQGNTHIPGCMASYPRFLEFWPGDDVAAFTSQVTCAALMGVRGCGFEQPLEAVLKALTPSTAPIAFNMGTSGHADGINNGFVRDDSVLAVLVLTDENDCSAADPEIFNPDTSVYRGDLNLRCFQYPEAVHPIERYVDGLLALRTDPDRLIFAAISGVPPDLVDDPSRTDFDAILADDRMREMVDPTMPTRLTPSCNVPGRGLSLPPRRIVQVAQQLEARGATAVVQSICQPDFTPPIEAILERLSSKLGTRCR